VASNDRLNPQATGPGSDNGEVLRCDKANDTASEHAQPFPLHFARMVDDRRLVPADQPGAVGVVDGKIAEPVRARSMMDHRKSPKSSAAPPPFALEDAQMCIENRDERPLSFIAAT
jgi:hypothetical protein